MKKLKKSSNLILWILSFVLMFATFIYQRRTGPTYPKRGEIYFAGEILKYKLPRSGVTGRDLKVELTVKNKKINGYILWRRYKFDKEWRKILMGREGEKLTAFLPSQPSAGKLEYFVVLKSEGKKAHIPDESAVVRFKGEVPLYILLPHIIFMFLAMLFSIRTGLEAILGGDRIKKYTEITFFTLLIGGFLLGPLVQKHAFGAFWTGIPFGWDLTDNKTLFAGIFWLIAYISVLKRKNERFYVVLASLVMFIVYLIPHSVMGSSFDYSKGKVIVGKE